MKLIWHIFKKDFGRQYLIYLLCILCGTYVGVMTRQGGNSAVVQDWLLMVAMISFYAFFFILVVEVVQEDSLIDSTAFWQTRPISSGRLLAAKGMFILGLLVVKFLASLAVWLVLPNPDHKAFGNWDVWLGMLSFALLSGGLAACTKNLGKCLLGLVICLVSFLVASAQADHWFGPIALNRMHQMVAEVVAQSRKLEPIRYVPGQLPWFAHLSASMVVGIIIGVAGAIALLIQYFTRRTAVASGLLFVAVLGAGVASSYCKWNALVGTASASPAVNWRVKQPVDVATFQFHPPPSRAKVVNEFFSRTLHPLVGKMARDFELNDLDGKPVKLSDLHGKTVVLDFWTTLCSASLSVVAEATSTRKAQGVVFYAVNLMESADKIRAFQKDQGLDFPVLLDSAGAVAKRYFAKHYLNKGIPQSVLIDKDGRIEAVNVGYTPGFKNELGQQLDDLIAGKSLLPGIVPSAPAKGP